MNPDMKNMQDHHPERGDQIEAWIKDRRDAVCSGIPPMGEEPPGWNELDSLLDEYRLAAATGMSLEEIVNGENHVLELLKTKKTRLSHQILEWGNES